MGLIKEPNGVDFIIKSDPLTEQEKITISRFIRDYKAKKKQSVRKRSGKKANGIATR